MTSKELAGWLAIGATVLGGSGAVKVGIDAQAELDQCQAERASHLAARIALLDEKGRAILSMGDQ